MLFKGIQELQEEIENLGDKLNLGDRFKSPKFKVYSSREMTAYLAKVIDKDVHQTIDIFSDMLQNFNFKKRKTEREILIYLDKYEEVRSPSVLNLLHTTAFRDGPLGRKGLRLAEDIKTITKKDLRKYISAHYTASRMVIFASGAVEHEEIVEQVKSMFTKLSDGSTTSSDVATKDTTIFTPSEFRIIDDDFDVAHFAIGFPGTSRTDQDFTTLKVINIMLQSSLEQRLEQKFGISEKHMGAFSLSYKDIGLFGVHAVTEPDCLNDVAYSIMFEMRQLCYKVSEDDVANARNRLKSVLLPHMDGTTIGRTDFEFNIGFQLLVYGRRIPHVEMLAEIDAIDVSTVKLVARRFILDKDFAIAAIGSVQGLPNYNWFRQRLQE